MTYKYDHKYYEIHIQTCKWIAMLIKSQHNYWSNLFKKIIQIKEIFQDSKNEFCFTYFCSRL